MANLVVKDNALVTASHKLSEVEQRLILLAIVQARKVGDSVELLKDKELTIHADDYIQMFGVERNAAYKSLKKAVLGLFEAKWGYKYINEKGNAAVRYERFTQSAEYIENEATVKFMFANAIIPLLVQLEHHFTKYELEQVAELSSQYAMRLYEFFMQHFDKNTKRGWLEISLEELRFRLGLLPTEYTLMSNFKQRVLDHSIKEINKHTRLTATYEQRKKGRTIVGFRFEFQESKPEKISYYKPDLFNNLTEPESTIIKQRIGEHIARLEQKGEVVSDWHKENITRKAISERWGVEDLPIQQLKKEQKARKEEEQKAREKAQDLENEKNKKRQQNMVEIFESLPTEQQNMVLDEVAKKLEFNSFKDIFNRERANQNAHKFPMFIGYFCTVLGIE